MLGSEAHGTELVQCGGGAVSSDVTNSVDTKFRFNQSLDKLRILVLDGLNNRSFSEGFRAARISGFEVMNE